MTALTTTLVDGAATAEVTSRMTTPAALADLLAAATVVSPEAVAAVCGALLAAPQTFPPDRVLLPLARALAAGPGESPGLPLPLRTALLDHLTTRIAAPLEPPQNWARGAALGCDCPDCRAVSAFLADPGKSEFAFKAAQDRRAHVEHAGRAAKVDVDYATIRAGSPHQLILRKTDASYRRRLAQRRQDLTDRALLARGPTTPHP